MKRPSCIWFHDREQEPLDTFSLEQSNLVYPDLSWNPDLFWINFDPVIHIIHTV